MSHLPSYELSFSVLQVFKTTTLIQDIASYAIDPRPWLIVFGKRLSEEEWHSMVEEYVTLIRVELSNMFKFREQMVLITKEGEHFTCKWSETEFANTSEEYKQDIRLYIYFLQSFYQSFHKRNCLLDWQYCVESNLFFVQLANIFFWVTTKNPDSAIDVSIVHELKYIHFPSDYIVNLEF